MSRAVAVDTPRSLTTTGTASDAGRALLVIWHVTAASAYSCPLLRYAYFGSNMRRKSPWSAFAGAATATEPTIVETANDARTMPTIADPVWSLRLLSTRHHRTSNERSEEWTTWRLKWEPGHTSSPDSPERVGPPLTTPAHPSSSTSGGPAGTVLTWQRFEHCLGLHLNRVCRTSASWFSLEW